MKNPHSPLTVLYALICTWALSGAYLTPLQAQCPQLVWSDEFDGNSLSMDKWEHQLGYGCPLCGWGNSELQSYQSENATVANGTLKITADVEGVGVSQLYTSARIRTRGLAEWTYGRFESRIKLPAGQGLWPAFWMMPTEEIYKSWPRSGEIDIVEIKGQSANVIYGTIHFGELWPNNRALGQHFLNPIEPFSDDFHIYAIEWEPDEIRWYVDDIHYSTWARDDVRGRLWPFDQDFHFLLNLAVGGTFVGDPDPSIFPVSMEVDYVRVYDGPQPGLDGPATVSRYASGTPYHLVNVPAGESGYQWSVTAPAKLVEGQGTSSVLVDWGVRGGQVQVALSGDCGTKILSLPVYVEPREAHELTLEDFETNRNLAHVFSPTPLCPVNSGPCFDDRAGNPDPSGINPSEVVGQYPRSPSQKYDLIVYSAPSLSDVGPYARSEKRFHMDLYTTAAPGTEVILQLERATNKAFPDDRHSTHTARTTRQNEWETLRFDFSGRLDGNTADTDVDNLVILFDPGWDSGDVYTFDNLSSYVIDEQPEGDTEAPTPPANLVATGISDRTVDLDWEAATDNEGVAGYVVLSGSSLLGTTSQTSFSVTGLSPKSEVSFRVRARDGAGNLSPPSNVLEVATRPLNLIANPGFESGTIDPWSGASITDQRKRSGMFAARITDQRLEQSIEGLSPDTTYRLSAWLATAGGEVTLGVEGVEAADWAEPVGGAEFSQSILFFSTGPTQTEVRIVVGASRHIFGSGWRRRRIVAYADDFELIEIE